MEIQNNSSSVYLKRLVDATVEWHLIFASDRVRLQMDPDIPGALEVFVGEARMVRWAMTATEDQLASVWDSVMPGSIEREDEDDTPLKRVNENIVDYVLMGTAYVTAMVPIPSGHFKEVVGDLARAITWPYRASAISPHMKDRAASSEYINTLFTENPWTLFMYLLSISPLPFDADRAPMDLGNTSSTGDAP